MPKKIILSALLCMATLLARPAEPNTVRIEPLRGERWWSVSGTFSPAETALQPLAADQSPHSGVRMLVSSSGRYLWCGTGAEAACDGQGITVTGLQSASGVERGGKTLREAYVLGLNRNLPERDSISYGFPCELFSELIYETEYESAGMQTQQSVVEYAAEITRRSLPAGYMVIADGWRDARGDFDAEAFPDPAAMLAALHEAGFKVILTVTPYMPASGRRFAELRNSGALVADSLGRPLYVDTGNGICTVLDIRRPECAAAVESSLAALKSRLDVDLLRFDCAQAWQMLPEDFAVQWRQMARRVGSTRVMTTPAANPSDRDEARMLHMMQMAVLRPMPRVLCSAWRIGDEQLRTLLENTLRMRASIAEYMLQTARQSLRTGEPIIRNMEYQFPRSGFADCTDQFMLGGKCLVAPAHRGQTSRMVRLPRGVWTDSSGKRYRGPVVTEVRTDNGQVACFFLQTK